ncbi:MAG: zinc-ribbon domain containing protein [Bacillota bacterium]
MYQDRKLTCRDCGNEFVFSASEQEFFAEKGFTNDPGRCPECRQARKNQNRRGGRDFGYARQERQMFPAVCAACGSQTQVPFQPSGDRPVYCKDCYRPSRY